MSKNCDRKCKLYQVIQRHFPSKFLSKRRGLIGYLGVGNGINYGTTAADGGSYLKKAGKFHLLWELEAKRIKYEPGQIIKKEKRLLCLELLRNAEFCYGNTLQDPDRKLEDYTFHAECCFRISENTNNSDEKNHF